MRIHKEGYIIIAINTLIFTALSAISCFFAPVFVYIPVLLISLFFVGFFFRFFRVPKRRLPVMDSSVVYSAADGKVVAIEEVDDDFLSEKRIQVSVFMSVWNVHINWFPVGGEVVQFQHHIGEFLVAWHPKSSTDNERTTTVVDTGRHKILFRQIAGLLARRIVNYAEEHVGEKFEQCEQCGFIKFGSRVDILLPLDADIKIKMGDKVVGTQTVIATLPR